MKTTVKCPHCLVNYTVFIPYEGKLVTCSMGRCAGQGKLFFSNGEWKVLMFQEIKNPKP